MTVDRHQKAFVLQDYYVYKQNRFYLTRILLKLQIKLQTVWLYISQGYTETINLPCGLSCPSPERPQLLLRCRTQYLFLPCRVATCHTTIVYVTLQFFYWPWTSYMNTDHFALVRLSTLKLKHFLSLGYRSFQHPTTKQWAIFLAVDTTQHCPDTPNFTMPPAYHLL